MTSISSIHTFGDTCNVFINEGGIELWCLYRRITADELPDLKAAIAFIESVLAERQRGGSYETGRDFGDENDACPPPLSSWHTFVPGTVAPFYTPVTGTLEGRWDDAFTAMEQRKDTCGTCDYFLTTRLDDGTLTGWCNCHYCSQPLDGSSSCGSYSRRPKQTPLP